MSSFSERMSTTEPGKQEGPLYEEDEHPVREFFKFLYEYFEVADKWQEMQKFGGHHPLISMFLIVTLGSFAVPLTVFLVFVICSLIFSFLGYLFFEGTILALGTFILGGVLFFVGLFAIGFNIFLLAGFYLFKISHGFLVRIRDKIHALQEEEVPGEEKEE